jgi:monoterpene epsilon-lactone hydrolase
MRSLRHRLLAAAVPVLRRAREVTDPEQVRRDVVAEQDRADQSPPSRAVHGMRLTELQGFGFPVYDVRASTRGDPVEAPTRTIVYLHGGALIAGLDRRHWRYAAHLAEATGVRVVLPAYPLAPRSTWREVHPPLLRLFEQLAIESPGGVTLAGDSAGGGLALTLAQQVAAGPGPQPTGLVLIAPWVDLAGSTPGTEEMRSRDRWLKLTKLRLFGEWWAGDDDIERPEVSPLHGSYDNLPPMLVFCGTRDLLLPQVRLMVDRARAAGVDVTYHEETGLIHVYPILPVPEARAAFTEVVTFLDR